MPAPSTPPAVLASAQAKLPVSGRIADYLVMTLSVVLGGGSIVLFAWPGRPTLIHMGLSPEGALWWNALMSLAFFVQHSVLVRRSLRARITAVIPARYDGACYSITSGIVLALVVMLYQPAGAPFLVLEGLSSAVVNAVAVLAAAAFAWGIVALRTFDPFGRRPIREHLRHEPSGLRATDKAFIVRGPYRWVRHPLYSAIIVMLWASPTIGPGRLELALLWTAWICLGAVLEERDLIAEFGETYRRYRQQVPMLFPWRQPFPASPAG
jgi:protein-S-isoprenylcysteine O-methyltransferase Ste14